MFTKDEAKAAANSVEASRRNHERLENDKWFSLFFAASFVARVLPKKLTNLDEAMELAYKLSVDFIDKSPMWIESRPAGTSATLSIEFANGVRGIYLIKRHVLLLSSPFNLDPESSGKGALSDFILKLMCKPPHYYYAIARQPSWEFQPVDNSVHSYLTS